MTVRIGVTSVLVDDQAKALAFYTDVLGFVKKIDQPLGEYRWLTVVSRDAPEGVELLLEPIDFPPAKTFQRALFEAGIPATAFMTDNIADEVDRLRKRGVAFKSLSDAGAKPPTAMLEDTCGNLIQLVEA